MNAPATPLHPTSQPAPQALDLLRFPLHGSRLIEASAGTGKTFTIAMLYLRLVLGPTRADGDDPAFARALMPPEILVVTFTEAATQELRDRIRHRLAQAARVFRDDPSLLTQPDPGSRQALQPLLDLRASHDPSTWPALARRLQTAAEWMDEAAVSTIHGWCRRMLREHAFDSGSLFDQTLEADQSELLAEAVRDYWRSFMVPLERTQVDQVLGWWQGPAELQKALKDLLPHADALGAADVNAPQRLLQDVDAQRLARVQQFKAPLPALVADFRRFFEQAAQDQAFNTRKLQARWLNDWLDKLDQWAASESQLPPDLKTGWDRLSPEGLAEVWKPDHPSPQHALLDALVALRPAIDGLPTARADLLRHATHWVQRRFADEQAQRAQMGFNDLLTRLDDALRGPSGVRLAQVIRQQFPVALIDEFQDTDPVQWRIFDQVYQVAANAPETAVVLIGDPKQAIYAFRGADIHTYLQARQACGDRLYTLGTNHRSTAAMVDAVNHGFLAAERRPEGAGAFLFRNPDGANPVPFLPARAAGRPERLCLDGQALPALTAWWLPPATDDQPLSREAFLRQMAETCASEMVRLLRGGQDGRCLIQPSDASRPAAVLQPRDLAVLVNHRGEADAIRAALARRGVRSVYLSDRESVFNTLQAGELQFWLGACAEPHDARRLRAALATATLGLSWAELDALRRDELAWETMEQRFRGYRERWQRQGVLPMVRQLLNDFRVPARLLGKGVDTGGERVLTDLLHLAELLQQASALIDGEHALVRHLAEQRQLAARGLGGDAPQLRLESDAGLVQVVTVHKSKGLEYPLVFYPYACHYRATRPEDTPLKWHDDQGRLQLDLAPEGRDAHLLARADQERLGEDLRKLYVALTRARHATWIGLAPIDGVHRSALGHLLTGGEAIAPDGLEAALRQWATGCPGIEVLGAPPPTADRLDTGTAAPPGDGARLSATVAATRWWVASYSALRTQATPAAAAPAEPTEPESPRQDQFQETPALPRTEPVEAADLSRLPVTRTVQPPPGSPHAFARGKEAGTFLHDLLEWCARRGFQAVLDDPAELRDQVARRCQTRGWSHWVDPLCRWLLDLIAAPLPLPGTVPGKDGDNAAPTAQPTPWSTPSTSLAGTVEAVAEMEFWIAARQVGAEAIDALVSRHTLDGAARPALAPERLNGMLKGFIDLVFEHQGRWYVADYKSNWLGPDDSAYHAAALRAEVLHARYDLQYVLYLLALHRLLRARLPDYDYDRHIGGAVYIFLRGLNGPAGGVHAERPPRALIDALDALFRGDTSPGLAASHPASALPLESPPC